MSADEPAALVYARLTGSQRRLVNAVTQAHLDFLTAEEIANTRQVVLHTKVSEGLAGRVPARLLADKLGVSVSRIYQIQRGVSRHRTEGLSGS
jgi:hypothetical protein